MTTRSRVVIGVRSGYATETTCKFSLCSLFSADITLIISLNGITIGNPYVLTLVAVGNTRLNPVTLNEAIFGVGAGTTSTAGYAQALTVTGLSKLTRYTWTASQFQNGVTVSESGTFMSAPSLTDDFRLLFGSCDNVKGGQATGAWQYVQERVTDNGLPVAAILWADDLGYVDNLTCDDLLVNGGTGHSIINTFPRTQGGAYEYVLAYMCALGMLEDTSNPVILNSRDTTRVWGSQNVNIIPQFGDHEFTDDLGWESTAIINYRYAGGRAAWDALLGVLQPDFTGTDVVANHWVGKYGSVNIISPDYITNAQGTGTTTVTTPVTQMLGTTQINDILNWVNTNPNTFNIFTMGFGIRYTSTITDIYYEFQLGSQHPIANHCVAEYEQLFTKIGNTPKSIMDSPYTNGQQGISIFCHGDFHRSTVHRQQAVGDGTHRSELFYTLHNGTFNGYANFTEVNPLFVGNTSSDGKVTKIADAGWSTGGGHYALTTLTILGSIPVKELHAQIFTSNVGELWHGRWLERLGNEVFTTTWEAPKVSASGSRNLT